MLAGTKLAASVAVSPVPERVTVWVPASSTTFSVAVRTPVAVGVKVTVKPHVRVGVSTSGMQKLVCEKSPALVPVMVALVRLIGTLPVLVMVAVCVKLANPTGCVLKPNLSGDRVAVALTASPLPERPTVCGLPVALSVMTTVPVRAPTAVGVNTTLILQVAGGVRNASVVQPLLVTRQSPLSTTRSMVTGRFPVLVTTIVSARALVCPTAWSAKSSEAGVMVMVSDVATPVPDNEKLCGLADVLSVMVTVPERTPAAVGEKVTRTLQAPPGFRVTTHPDAR